MTDTRTPEELRTEAAKRDQEAHDLFGKVIYG